MVVTKISKILYGDTFSAPAILLGNKGLQMPARHLKTFKIPARLQTFW